MSPSRVACRPLAAALAKAFGCGLLVCCVASPDADACATRGSADWNTTCLVRFLEALAACAPHRRSLRGQHAGRDGAAVRHRRRSSSAAAKAVMQRELQHLLETRVGVRGQR